MVSIKGKRSKMAYKPLTIIAMMMVIAYACIIFISNSNNNKNKNNNDNIDQSMNFIIFPGEKDQKNKGEKEFLCTPTKAIYPLKDRNEIGDLLQEFDLKTGIEVGVKQGLYAETLLKKWKSCTNYKLVDLWAHQTNYKDVANVRNEKHESFYQETKTRLKPWADKTEYYKMRSTEASKLIADKLKKKGPQEEESSSLVDFIYVDARHDYCGVTTDLEHYWTLLKPGGIMAGDDYKTNDEVRGQDWGLCEDGSRNDSAVKGAVNDFFVPRGITVSVMYRDNGNSWMVQKPMC